MADNKGRSMTVDSIEAAPPSENMPKPLPSEEISKKPPSPDISPATPSWCLKSHCRYVKYEVNGHIFNVTENYTVPMVFFGECTNRVSCLAYDKQRNEYVLIVKVNAFKTIGDALKTLKEIKQLRHMNHANIIALKDLIRPQRGKKFEHVYMVFEHMDSDLDKIIKNELQNAEPDEDFCQLMLYQLLCALKYLHSANIVHRNIRPECLLVNKDDDLKICDLGTLLGTTINYNAPEFLLDMPVYTTATDVWAAGVILMELLTGKRLLTAYNRLHLLHLISQLIGTPPKDELEFLSESAKHELKFIPVSPRIPLAQKYPKFSSLAMDLAEKMLAFNPSGRITVDEALAHPYLNYLHDGIQEPVCETPFKYAFYGPGVSLEQLKNMVYQEIISFNTEQH